MQRAELLLERVAILTEAQGQQVGADARGLHSVVTSTCKVMGMRALQANNSGSAMGWGLHSGDSKLTTFLVDKLLSEYASSSTVRVRIILTIETSFICIKCIECNAIICISVLFKSQFHSNINICKSNYCSPVILNLLSYRVPTTTMRLLATFLVLLLIRPWPRNLLDLS